MAKSARRNHMETVHFKANIKGKCYICHKEMAKELVEKHIKKTHLQEGQAWCDICKKNVANATVLKAHYDTVHLKIMQFTCQYCG